MDTVPNTTFPGELISVCWGIADSDHVKIMWKVKYLAFLKVQSDSLPLRVMFKQLSVCLYSVKIPQY